MDFTHYSVGGLIGLFLASAVAIGFFGSWLTRLADKLADATGWGEALMGGILLGGVTSLSGIITSVTAAANNHPGLALSNALGGIAAQTVFLAIADLAYRRANLEHAASSLSNMLQATLLMILLSMPLLAMAAPQISLLRVHPMSFAILIAYGLGMRMTARSRRRPMWTPRITPETRADRPHRLHLTRRQVAALWSQFAVCGGVVSGAGYVVAQTGIALQAETGLSEALIGGLFTAVITSLPELVTSVAAVRQGALTLAVGGIVGGNCFDVLFVSFSDLAYRQGSIYHAVGRSQIFMLGLTLLLTGVLLLGMLRREKHGIGNIGFESFLILVLYVGAFALISWQG